MTRFGCPTCKSVLQAAAAQAGAIIACPKCQMKLRVPAAVPAPVGAAAVSSPAAPPVAPESPPVAATRPSPTPAIAPIPITLPVAKKAPENAPVRPNVAQPAMPAAQPKAVAAPASPAGPAASPAPIEEPQLGHTPSQFDQATFANLGKNDMHGYAIIPEEDERDLMSFLAPAQKPDEIGRLGPYRVLTLLGAGGMGVVFKAEDPQLERPVAIKAMLPSLAASAMATKRFLREAKLAARIKHNNIVTIYSVGEDQGVPYLAMEFLEGESLDQRLKRERRLPLEEVVRIGREIADGLAAAHEKTMIHRDIKPANIWLEGKQSQVKILDFGLARTVSDQTHLTQSGAILGTPAYMAPEQFGGKGVDQRCDVFSLGCVLYAMCTGELPFKGVDTMGILQAIAMNAPTDPATLRRDAPPRLCKLIMRMLAKNAEQRPAAMQEVADELRDIGMDLLPRYRTHLPLAEQFKELLSRLLSQLKPVVPVVKRWSAVAWHHIQLGLTAVAVHVEKWVVYLLERARLGDMLDRKLPRGTRKRRPVLVGLAALVVCMVLCPMLLLMRQRPSSSADQDDAPAIVLDNPARKTPLTMVVQLGHADGLTSVAMSSDGTWLATGSRDGTARLWDVASGREMRTFKGHSGAVTCVAFSEDDGTLATGSSDTTARLWRVNDGEEIAAFRQHTDTVVSVLFSRDGKWLVTASADRTARKWNLEQREIATVFKGHAAGIVSAVLSSDARWLATGGADRSARVWDMATGKEHRPRDADRPFLQIGDKLASSAVAFSRDGKWLAVGPHVLHMSTGQEFRDFHLPKSEVRFVAFSPDGKWLICAGDSTRLWDLTAEKEVVDPEKMDKPARPKPGHVIAGRIGAAFLTRDGSRLAATFGDYNSERSAFIKELPSGKMLQIFQGQAVPVLCAAFSRDGKWLVSGGDDRIAHLWKLPSGKEIHAFQEANAVRSAALSADGKLLALARGDGARLWDTGLLQAVRNYPAASAVALNAAGSLLATANNDNAARLWDPASEKELRVFKEHSGSVNALAFSDDGNWLLTGSSDRTARLWNLKSGQEARAFAARSAVYAAAISADGTRLAAGGEDGIARLWDGSAKELQSFTGHTGPIRSLALSADGTLLATASADGSARLWDAGNGKEIRAFRGHAGAINSLALSADRQWLVTAGSDCTTRLWDLASGRELCQLISFRDQSWAVIDAEGRYDSLNDGNAAQGLHWVHGTTITAIDENTRARFHDAGLLARHLKFLDSPRSVGN